MYGKNESEPWLAKDLGKQLDVVDTFFTIQGEGPDAGRGAYFIRLAGCHLKCYFCDTDFLSGRTARSIEDLAAQAKEALAGQKNPLVVLTGGEPLRQNVVPLCVALERVMPEVRIQIETSGTLWVGDADDAQKLITLCLWRRVSIVVSPKTPTVHEKVARYATAWKYIVGADTELDQDDGLPVSSTQLPGRYARLSRPDNLDRPLIAERVYVQPLDYGKDAPDLNQAAIARCVALVMRRGYRLSLQVHKLVGLP